MKFYDTTQIFELLKSAFQGNGDARMELHSITAPCAVAEDYSAMILVQEKYAVINETGHIKALHMQPKQESERTQSADIYQCNPNGVSWSSILIPYSFPVSSMSYNDGIFYFVSDSNQQVGGNIAQIKKAMFEVTFALDGAMKHDIESCFFSIPETIVECLAKRTTHQNPPIKDAVIGTLSFDEQLQQYQAFCRVKDRFFTLRIQIIERSDVLKLLPIVRSRLNKFKEIDTMAKEFAIDELLVLKNGSWLEPNEKLLSRKDFAVRMSIEDIAFYKSGEFEMWYNDGNLFEGHSISVNFNEYGQPQSAEING